MTPMLVHPGEMHLRPARKSQMAWALEVQRPSLHF